MKFQTGVRVEQDTWQAYRAICKREKLRPAQPIENFLRLTVNNDSAQYTLSVIKEAAKTKTEGVNAHTRVLLYYFTHGKFWIQDGDEKEISVEAQLLEALKTVNDDLRAQIEQALIEHQRQQEEREKAREEQQRTEEEQKTST